MYEKFYGFSEKPFALAPDPAFLFLGGRHAVGLSLLQYGLLNRSALIVLTGAIGTGKTTLVRRLLDEADGNMTVGLISNTHEAFGSLMQWIAVAFGLPAKTNKATQYDRFAHFLIEQYAKGKRCVLVVDEAQNLSEKALEELRLLTNINADKDLLLQLVLVGQPELRERLRQPSLVQLVQRIGADYHLSALSAEETDQYIDHRLVTAGGSAGLFEPAAMRFIHFQCDGVPRLINSLCDTALVYGFASGEARISIDLVFDLVKERIANGLFAAVGEAFEAPDTEKALEAARENAQRARSETGVPALAIAQ
ncbi:MAG: AAA family ATPase [Proteobacteria bacterium]|nr:AAA family ATPase [Pseudomonadota bacterium]